MNVPTKKEGFVADEPIDDDAAAVAAEPVAAAAQAPVEQWPIVVRLRHKPLRNARNETVQDLSFREPTGGDINRYGNPVRVQYDGEIVVDEKKMSMMMSSLSGILLPMFEQIDPRDWNTCYYRLRIFFLPDPTAW